MPSYLCLSVTFLDPAFHGRGDNDGAEWPPAPLRLYQALVAAAAARWNERQQLAYSVPALRWLAEQDPPMVVAPPGVEGAAYRLSVPNNALDVVARAWLRGNDTGKGDANPATHRAMKTVRPTRLPAGDCVSYVWELPDPLTDEVRGHVEVLSAAARSLVALGWGVDLVAGDGRVLSGAEADALPGERWRPTGGPAPVALRVPVPGTLDELTQRHRQFLDRLEGDRLTPVPALGAFAPVGYRREADPPARAYAAFALLRPDASGFRPFDARRPAVVAGMVRHAARQAAESAGWDRDQVAGFILGHGGGPNGQAKGPTADARFAYLPLPSVEGRGRDERPRSRVVTDIRRVLVVGPPGRGALEVTWAQQALSGRELIDERAGQPVALLSLLPHSDARLRPYLRPAADWCTVTPVVLPGYDDRDARKTEALLRKAIAQAGFPAELAARAELDWRSAGFVTGVDLAPRYDLPAQLVRGGPRYHVRVCWRDTSGKPVAVPGPVAVGAGRYCGLGVFIADD